MLWANGKLRVEGQFGLSFIYGFDKSRERISCDNSERHMKGRETKAEFAEVGAMLGCVYCKKQEGYWKSYLGGQPSEFSLFTFT